MILKDKIIEDSYLQFVWCVECGDHLMENLDKNLFLSQYFDKIHQ